MSPSTVSKGVEGQHDARLKKVQLVTIASKTGLPGDTSNLSKPRGPIDVRTMLARVLAARMLFCCIAFRQFYACHQNSSRMRLTLMAGIPLRRVFLLCSRTTMIGRPVRQ